MASNNSSSVKNFFEQCYSSSAHQRLSTADVFERKSGLDKHAHLQETAEKLVALDVGCGYGRYAKYLIDTGYFYIDVDPVAENIKKLEFALIAFGFAKGQDFELYSGTLESLSLEVLNKKCDVAPSINVIHHTASPQVYVKNLAKWIRTAGARTVVEPSPRNPLHWISYALQRSLTEEWKFLIYNPIYLLSIFNFIGQTKFSSLGPLPLRLLNLSVKFVPIFRSWVKYRWSSLDPFCQNEVKIS
jgi:SAM-dependent methyltransferase